MAAGGTGSGVVMGLARCGLRVYGVRGIPLALFLKAIRDGRLREITPEDLSGARGHGPG